MRPEAKIPRWKLAERWVTDTPLYRYNKEFGGKPGSAEKAHDAMQAEYGPKKGEQVFYATKNKREKQFSRGAKK